MTTPYRLVTAGRLTTWKGIDGLLAAIMPWEDVGLLVAGDGPQRPALESLARRLGMQQRVHFAGWMERPALLGALRACDLFVYNARFATLPHVLLEAWAAGLPIVAAATGGIPELINDGVNGRMVPPGERAVLRDAIRAALDDPITRGAWRDAGLSTARRFSVDAMVGLTAGASRGDNEVKRPRPTLVDDSRPSRVNDTLTSSPPAGSTRRRSR